MGVNSSHQYEKKGEIRAVDQKEEVHVVCEPEQGVYINEESDEDDEERSSQDLNGFYAEEKNMKNGK